MSREDEGQSGAQKEDGEEGGGGHRDTGPTHREIETGKWRVRGGVGGAKAI